MGSGCHTRTPLFTLFRCFVGTLESRDPLRDLGRGTVPIFIIVASVFAVVCTAGLALPVLVLVIVAFACRRPPELDDPWAIATVPSWRGIPVEVVVS
jgi:hypothetical protein